MSPNRVPALTHYIDIQEEHHRTEAYQEEVRRFCQEYGAPLDERYMWD